MTQYYDFALTDEEAKARFKEFVEKDPFPSVPRALLSSAEIHDYARVTGMIFPFNEKGLKSASYEVHLGGDFIIWHADGRKVVQPLEKGKPCKLLANSISFVQVEPTFRLPNYMALRFNLRITHVHRGLLLGTGPLVDPGFEGKLLIPIHNLTASDYELDTQKALIWIEFTKTTYKVEPEENEASSVRYFRPFPEGGKYKSPDEYFFKANRGEPIRSSIPLVMAESREDARRAAESAKSIRRMVAGIGALASVLGFGAIVGLAFQTISIAQDSTTLSKDVSNQLTNLVVSDKEQKRDITILREGLRNLTAEVQATSNMLPSQTATNSDLDVLVQRIADLERRLDELSQR